MKRASAQIEGQIDVFDVLAELDTTPVPAPVAGPARPLAPLDDAAAAWIAEHVLEAWTDANDLLPGAGPILAAHMAGGCQRSGRPVARLGASRRNLLPPKRAGGWPYPMNHWVFLADDPNPYYLHRPEGESR